MWAIVITLFGVTVSASILKTQVLANTQEIVEMKIVLKQVSENQTKILLIQQKNDFTDKQLMEINENIKDIKKTLSIR